MKLQEIEQAVLKGELILEKIYLGKLYKRKYIWDDKTEHILDVKRIEFDGWSYRAVLKNETYKGYKISKKVFNSLVKQLSHPPLQLLST